MNPTKRHRGQDQLGRSGSAFPIRLLSLTLFAVIVGSAWPISARSLDPAYDRCGTKPKRSAWTWRACAESAHASKHGLRPDP